MLSPAISRDKNAVSIITCTNRKHCMNSLFQNYNRQNHRNKELIVILNSKSLQVNEYLLAAQKYKNVRIYSLPDISLGNCLNFGVELSRHPLIAKFDDDDYYAPNYLADSMRVMHKTKADIVGKRAHYMYLYGKKLLLLRYPNQSNRYVSMIQGATLLVKREVFKQVVFADLNRGECVKFCTDSLAKRFKIYSGSKYNSLAFRRSNSKDHTWIISDKHLLTRNVKVLKAKDIRRYVSRS